MKKCKLCDFEYEDEVEFEKHLKEYHFLTIQDYYEMNLLGNIKSETCGRCGKEMPVVSYILDDDPYYIPCWDCVVENKFTKKSSIQTLLNAVLEYTGRVTNDRFLQMFLINDVYFQNTLNHNFSEFKNVLKLLQKKYECDRNKIWFIDWKKGFPKIISPINIDGLRVVMVDKYYKIEQTDDYIVVNDWKINYPEILSSPQSQFARYNIFNPSKETRNCKRLRLKDLDMFIKLTDHSVSPEDNSRALFLVENLKTGEVGKTENISEQDLAVIKLVLMRNKRFMKLLQATTKEAISISRLYSDSVLLRNTVNLNGDKDICVNFCWINKEIKNNFINITVL